MDNLTKHLHIRGRVQGVFFRESMRHKAVELGIHGWVRNCADGSVEAVIQGTAPAVEAMIAWARRGPDRARVDRLEISDATGTFGEFERLPSR
jgi:acylphosphatase